MKIGKNLLNKTKKVSKKKHYLYFLLDEEYSAVKIGITADLKGRIKSIQCVNLHPLKLLKSIECRPVLLNDLLGCSGLSGTDIYLKQIPAKRISLTKEKEIHEEFQNYQIKGEWFKYEGKVKNFIENING